MAMLVAASCGDDTDPAPAADTDATASDASATSATSATSTTTTATDTDTDTDTTGEETAPDPTTEDDRFPTIIGVEAAPDGDGTFRFDVTISSPYDTPERYADGWRVLDPDGTELGFRLLGHDHADEQPFTRSLSAVAIPADIAIVEIEARDLVNGWSGVTVPIDVPH